MNPVAEALRMCLKDGGHRIPDLVAATGIHRVNLHQFRSGARDLNPDDLNRLAEAMECEIVVKLRSKKSRKNSANSS